jgi:hypothetical protein
MEFSNFSRETCCTNYQVQYLLHYRHFLLCFLFYIIDSVDLLLILVTQYYSLLQRPALRHLQPRQFLSCLHLLPPLLLARLKLVASRQSSRILIPVKYYLLNLFPSVHLMFYSL